MWKICHRTVKAGHGALLAVCSATIDLSRCRMKSTRWLVTLAMVGLFGPAVRAQAASNPKAITVRIKCQLEGVNSIVPNDPNKCTSLNGWFDGRLDWVSDGTVLFQENGPFAGVQSGTDEVIIFADGNNSDATFQAIYEDPKSSIFTAPNLMLRLYTLSKGAYIKVTEQQYMPAGSALWAKHSEDSAAVQADIAAIKKAMADDEAEDT